MLIAGIKLELAREYWHADCLPSDTEDMRVRCFECCDVILAGEKFLEGAFLDSEVFAHAACLEQLPPESVADDRVVAEPLEGSKNSK